MALPFPLPTAQTRDTYQPWGHPLPFLACFEAMVDLRTWLYLKAETKPQFPHRHMIISQLQRETPLCHLPYQTVTAGALLIRSSIAAISSVVRFVAACVRHSGQVGAGRDLPVRQVPHTAARGVPWLE